MSETTPPENTGKISRRKLLKRWSAGITAVAGVSCAVDGFFIEPHGYTTPRHTFPIPGLSPAWDGTTIAHITDLHIGPLSNTDDARKIVDLTNALKPDIVVLTGDYVSNANAITIALAEVLGNLRPRIGSFAVLGNHDYWADETAMRRTFDAAGIPVLVMNTRSSNGTDTPSAWPGWTT